MNIDGGRLSFDAYIKDADFNRQLAAMEQKITNLAQTTEQQSRKMDNMFANLAKSAAAFLTVNQVSNFVQQLINVRSEFQQLEIAFTTMLRSKEKADQLTKDLIEFASTTPFGMSDAANAAKQLLAYGSAAENVTEELRMLGDVAAGTSQPIGELVYLYGTLRTQGRAYTQDIRQFAGRGIPIYKELAKVLGVAEDQVNNLVTSGKVGFAEVEQAFKNMTAAGSMFGGLMEAQSQTIQGELERLGDATEQMFNEIGKGTEGAISKIIQGTSIVVENYRVVLDILAGLVVTYGAYRAALIATAAVQQVAAARAAGMTAAEMLHLGAISAKTAALKALNAVMLASPIVAMTAAITVLTGVIYSLTQITNAAELAQNKLNEVQEAGAKSADKERRSIEQLISVLKSNTSSAEQKKSAYDKLIGQTDGILNSFSQEEIAAGKATEALDDYIRKIQEAAAARKAFDEFNALAEQLDALSRNGVKSISVWERLGRSLKNTFAPSGMTFQQWWGALFDGEAANKLMVDQVGSGIQSGMDELKKLYGDKWEEIITGVSPQDAGRPVVAVSERLKELSTEIAKTEADLKKALSPNADYDRSAIEKLQTSLKELREERDLLMGKSKEGDRANKELQQWADKRIDILQSLADRENELRLRGMSADDQEIERAKLHYAEIRRIIEEHNKKAPAGARIGSEVQSKVDKMEQEETGFLVSEQQVKKDLENIAKLDKASDQLIAINDKISVLEGEKYAHGLTAAKESELRQYKEIQKELQDQQKKDMNDLLKTLITYESQRNKLIAEYREKRKEIEAAGNAENLQVFDQQHRETLAALDDTNVQKLDAYKDLFGGIEDMTDAMARKVIANAIAMVNGLEASGKISKELAKEIRAQIKETQKSLDERLPERLDDLASGFSQIAAGIGEMNQGLGNALGILGDMIRAASQIHRAIPDLMSGIQNYQANRTAGGGGVIGGISAIAGVLGPASAIVGAVSGVIGGIKNLLNASKRARDEQRAFLAEQRTGEAEYARMMRDRERTQQNINELTREEIALRKELLETQQEAVQSDHDRALAELQAQGTYRAGTKRVKVPGTGFFGWGASYMDVPDIQSLAGMSYEEIEELYHGKKLSDSAARMFEALRLLREEIEEIEDASQQIEEQRKDRASGGITAKSISDPIIQGLREGKRAFADFAENAEEMVKNALLSAMQYTVLEEPIQELVKQFREDSLDGLDAAEIQRFRDGYQHIVQSGIDAMKGIEAVVGPISSPHEDAARFRGRISPSITEQTGNQIYAAELRKVDLLTTQGKLAAEAKFLMDQQLNLMSDKFAVLNGIRDNTAAAVSELRIAVRELQEINKNTNQKTGRNSIYGT